jgi:type VI secretion system protein ImpG
MESFAFIAARIHTKLDDEFPEVIESLFTIIYPHYLRPMPSASIVQLHLDPEQGRLTSGLKVAKDSVLYSAPVNGVPCKFRTCYETTLWPIDVKSADWRSADRVTPVVPGVSGMAVVRLELQCFEDVTFAKLGLKSLRFFLANTIDFDP